MRHHFRVEIHDGDWVKSDQEDGDVAHKKSRKRI